MTRKEFVDAIEKLRSYEDFLEKLSKLDIETINCKPTEMPGFFFGQWVKEVFGKEGLDLVEWWLYEDVEKFIYKPGTCKKEVYFKGEPHDGEIEADLTDVDDLYDYLLVNYKKK